MKPIVRALLVSLMVWFFGQVVCTVILEGLDRTGSIRLSGGIIKFLNVIPVALGLIAFGLTFIITKRTQ